MSSRTFISDLGLAPDAEAGRPKSYAVNVANRPRAAYGHGPTGFELVFRTDADYQRFLDGDIYSVATDFIEGRFDIRGDLVSAVAFKSRRPGTSFNRLRGALMAMASAWRVERLFQSKAQARSNIEFHYDRSDDFYRAFLDSRMVYSCAYFEGPSDSLEEAQLAKLDLICRKLDVQPGERFLDIGCGWGALLLHAVTEYGAVACGCTLSRSQADYALKSAELQGFADRLRVQKADFRDISGVFDKVASVGMFEHVGRKRLNRYFQKVFDLLSPGGRFLNHGIVRPQSVKDGPESRFLRNYVFPGGELVHLADVVRAAENVGFEALDVENLRPHYAMTCRQWVRRLLENESQCLEAVDQKTYRIWLLYLSASALSFQEGRTDVCQVLFAKRSSRTRRLTRDYILRGDHGKS
jgi:cyclopropane-fatty-acyl-phospholipid synthase